MADKTELKFECPRLGCNGATLEEIQTNCTVTSVIGKITLPDDPESELEVDYTRQNDVSDGGIDRYQCHLCGYVLPDVSDYASLAEFLKTRQNPT